MLALALALQITATLPVTCTPTGALCTTATPVTNPDGTPIGAGGSGTSQRTTAAGTSDTQAVPVQGVTGGVPQAVSTAQLPASLGQKTNAAGLAVTLSSDGSYATSALQTTGNTSLGTLAGTVTTAGSPAGNAQTVQVVSSGTPVATALRGTSNLATAQVSVGTTATLVAAARTGRSRLVITQAAAGPCYYGPTNTVSATTGARLIAAGASKVYQFAGALYGICPGGAVTTDTDEEY